MQVADFTADRPGRLVRAPGGYWAFVPNPLPPALELSWELAGRLSDADRAVAELAGVARNLPNAHLLIRPFMRREAVLSSRIEGTRASIADLVLFEAHAEPPPELAPPSDVLEVHNYALALAYGLKRLGDLPLSLRLVREIHERLMRGARGEHLTPGEFRRSQNWIGPAGCTIDEATFVPAPMPEMHEALDALEKSLHSKSALPPLVRLALVHYQFEAIHPFLDGNGRVGRLLISLLLCEEGVLPQPLLYLSAYFEKRRPRYYDLLLDVSRRGTWSDWVGFFLEGVTDQSRDALWRIGKVLDLWHAYRQRFETARSPALLLALVDRLFENPAVTIPDAARRLKVTNRSARLIIDKLVAAGILEEITGRERYKVFLSRGIMKTAEAVRPA